VYIFELIQRHKSLSTFEPCPRKKATWKTKILEVDKDAIAEDDCQTVRHSICGRTMKNKEPYDVSRFREHIIKKCAQQKPTPAARMLTVTQWTKKFNVSLTDVAGSEPEVHPLKATLLSTGLPCPGQSISLI
jgi:hypothetical protein